MLQPPWHFLLVLQIHQPFCASGTLGSFFCWNFPHPPFLPFIPGHIQVQVCVTWATSACLLPIAHFLGTTLHGVVRQGGQQTCKLKAVSRLTHTHTFSLSSSQSTRLPRRPHLGKYTHCPPHPRSGPIGQGARASQNWHHEEKEQAEGQAGGLVLTRFLGPQSSPSQFAHLSLDRPCHLLPSHIQHTPGLVSMVLKRNTSWLLHLVVHSILEQAIPHRSQGGNTFSHTLC